MIESLIIFGSMGILLWVLFRLDVASRTRKPLQLGWLGLRNEADTLKPDAAQPKPQKGRHA